MVKFLGLILILFTLSEGIEAQTGLWFQNWDIEDGLPTSNVHTTFLDSHGFLWAGTMDGLCRFDSFEFYCIRAQDSDSITIPSSQINKIIEGPKGNIWVSTRQGISIINPKTLQVQSSYEFPNTEGSYDLFQFDSLVVSASHLGWYAFNIEGEVVSSRLFGKDKVPFFISGRFVTKAEAGKRMVYQVNIKDNFSYSDSVQITGPDFLVEYSNQWQNDTTLIRLDNKGNVYKHVYNFSSGLVKTSLIGSGISDPRRVKIAFDDKGSFWMGVDPNLYFVQKIEEDEYVVKKIDTNGNISFGNRAVGYTHIYLDREDRLWMGDGNNGLSMLDTNQLVFKYINVQNLGFKSIQRDAIWGIKEEPGKSIMLSSGHGLVIGELKEDAFSKYKFLENGLDDIKLITNPETYRNTINTHYFDGSYYFNVIYQGIYQYKEGGKVELIYPNAFTGEVTSDELRIMAYEPINDSTLLWSYQGGLLLHDLNKNSFERLQLNPSPDTLKIFNVLGIDIERQSEEEWTAYLATGWGSLKYQYPSGKLESLETPEDLLTRKGWTVFDIDFRDDSTLVRAFMEKGIEVWDQKNHSIQVFDETNGLANESTYSAITDYKGRIWTSHNKGLSCIFPSENKIVNFYHRDGLRFSEFSQNAFRKISNNYLAFGGHGAIFFHPDSVLALKEKQAKIILNKLKFNRIEEHVPSVNHFVDEDEIKIGYKNNSFEIGFTEIDFSNNNGVEYSYRLLGESDEWIESSRNIRTAYFQNIDPGEYTFQVRTKREAEDWSSPLINLGIIIPAPFWLSKWFLTLTGILGLGIVAGIAIRGSNSWYKQVIKRLEKEQKEMTEREQLSRDLHDSIGSQLSLIARHLEQVESKEDEESQIRLEAANQTTRYTISQLRETLWALKNEEVHISRLAERLKDLIRRMSLASNLEVKSNINIKVDKKLKPIVILHVFRIIQEITNNAIKYSDADEIELTVCSVKKSEWSIRISDNGKGIEEKKLNNEESYGLKHIQHRVKEIDANIKLNTEKNKGTEFVITFRA